jgi:Fe-S cluster biogenesis protein NfuA
MLTDPNTTVEADRVSPFTRADVEAVLDRVRPGLARHGGGIELVCLEGCNVRVLLRGACIGCPSSAMTLRQGIERTLREELAGFGDLIADEPKALSGPAWFQKFVDCEL